MNQVRRDSRFLATFLGIVAVIAWALTLISAKVLSISHLETGVKSLGVATFVCSVGLSVLNSFLWCYWPFS